jgi:small-conductance mechanosensitive channel
MPPLTDAQLVTIGEVGLQLALVVLATIIALAFVSVVIRLALGRLFQREVDEGTVSQVGAFELERRRLTLEGLLNRALRVIILVIAFLMALAVLRLDIGPAIAGLGILGLAISLGTQNLVRDYVAGAFVLIENQYAKGDVVTIAGLTGSVEDISLRRTMLRDLDGAVHFVPHSQLTTVSNQTRGWAGINIDLPIAYGSSLEQVSALVDQAWAEMAQEDQWRARVLTPPQVLRVDKLAEGGMVVKIAGRTAPGDQWLVTGELRRRIIEASDKAGLKIGWH